MGFIWKASAGGLGIGAPLSTRDTPPRWRSTCCDHSARGRDLFRRAVNDCRRDRSEVNERAVPERARQLDVAREQQPHAGARPSARDLLSPEQHEQANAVARVRHLRVVEPALRVLTGVRARIAGAGLELQMEDSVSGPQASVPAEAQMPRNHLSSAHNAFGIAAAELADRPATVFAV